MSITRTIARIQESQANRAELGRPPLTHRSSRPNTPTIMDKLCAGGVSRNSARLSLPGRHDRLDIFRSLNCANGRHLTADDERSSLWDAGRVMSRAGMSWSNEWACIMVALWATSEVSRGRGSVWEAR